MVTNTSGDVAMLASGLEAGGKLRDVCPACGGGTKRERSLLISADEAGRISWICFRASCGERGSSVRSALPPKVRRRNQALRPFRGELSPLSEDERHFLYRRIGFTSWHVTQSGVMYAPSQERFAFPIYGSTRLRRGYLLRSWLEDPKALTRMDRAEPHLSYYPTSRPGCSAAVVVEDIPSAVRASRYVSSVALLGTSCTIEYAAEIKSFCTSVVWALDEDATEIAIKHHRKHGILFDSSEVLCLPKDFKDMDEEELETILAGIRNK